MQKRVDIHKQTFLPHHTPTNRAGTLGPKQMQHFSNTLVDRLASCSCSATQSREHLQISAAGAHTVSSRNSSPSPLSSNSSFGQGCTVRRQISRGPSQQAATTVLQQEERPHMLHVDPSVFDLSYWHYKPWWWQPPMIVGAGVAFVVIANILDEACIKTTMLACCTVGVWWGVCLYALPRSFRSFATEYIESHDFPEDQLQKQVQDSALCRIEDDDQNNQQRDAEQRTVSAAWKHID